jgi:hypothetical protein
MRISANLNRLIEAAEPLWAGEAEVVRTYWDSPVRTIETDLLWLARQASKEFNGSGAAEFKNLGVFMGPVTELLEMFPSIDRGVSRHEAFERIEMLSEEFEHYTLFADVYDAIRPDGTPPLNPHDVVPWDEDVALNAFRHKAMAEHGEIGRRATKFSEGGYCTLFREGMRLEGRGGADALIAAACREIYDDEFGHMLSGIVGLDDSKLSDEEWRLMTDLVVEILRHRIHMRNAEFSFPLPQKRIEAIFAGDIAPEKFDFAKAELEPA